MNDGIARRRRILLALAEDRPYPPTVRELGQSIGLKSPSSVHSHLRHLERMGMVRWNPYLPRTLRITATGRLYIAADRVHR